MDDAFREYHSKLLADAEVNSDVFSDVLMTVEEGLVMEFGVYEGESLRYIANCLPLSPVFGFDSFLGLPEDWTNTDIAGTFKCDPPKNLPVNVKLIIGLFQHTLPGFMAEHKRHPVTFVHIDCDLYSSTKCVLDNIKHRLIDGSILAFDEIIKNANHVEHEFKAFCEFIEETGYSYECIGRRKEFSSIVRIRK